MSSARQPWSWPHPIPPSCSAAAETPVRVGFLECRLYSRLGWLTPPVWDLQAALYSIIRGRRTWSRHSATASPTPPTRPARPVALAARRVRRGHHRHQHPGQWCLCLSALTGDRCARAGGGRMRSYPDDAPVLRGSSPLRRRSGGAAVRRFRPGPPRQCAWTGRLPRSRSAADSGIAAFPPRACGRAHQRISLLDRGCPYDCGFCTDWNSIYRPRRADEVAADLASSPALPGTLLVFHVRISRAMDDALDLRTRCGRSSQPLPDACSMSVLNAATHDRLSDALPVCRAGPRICRVVGSCGSGVRLTVRGRRVAGWSRARWSCTDVPRCGQFRLGARRDLGDEPFDRAGVLRRTALCLANITSGRPMGAAFPGCLEASGRLSSDAAGAAVLALSDFVPRHYTRWV